MGVKDTAISSFVISFLIVYQTTQLDRLCCVGMWLQSALSLDIATIVIASVFLLLNLSSYFWYDRAKPVFYQLALQEILEGVCMLSIMEDTEFPINCNLEKGDSLWLEIKQSQTGVC